jgi:hypothetical protein
MTTFQKTFAPSKRGEVTKIPGPTLEYFRTRNKLRVFDLVQKEFEKSGLTQKELAARLGKGADQVCRLLGAPGNWTLETVSDLLIAISGSELAYSASPPRARHEPAQKRAAPLSDDAAPSPRTRSANRALR